MDPKSPNPESDEARLDRAYNMAVTALDVLYELAGDGSRLASALLIGLASSASSAAGKACEIWDLICSQQQPPF